MKTLKTLLAGCAMVAIGAASAQAVTLIGAVQFDENHAFTKALRKFEELTKECYSGDVEFELTYDRRGELSGFSVVQERARL